MTVKNMKITAAEQKAKAKEYQDCKPCPDGSRYPYGLELRLDNDSLKKLGMTSLPKAGAKMTIAAVGVVTSVRSSQRSNGEEDRGVEIQLQKLEVTPGAEAGSAEEAMDDAIGDAE